MTSQALMTSRLRARHLLPALLVFVLAACGGSTVETVAPPPAPVLSTADGGLLDFNDLEGRDVMLWFWAPW